MAAYKSAIPKVAVVNFRNNTTFEYANVVESHVRGSGERTTVGAAGIAVGPGVAGAVWGEKEKRKFKRDAQTIQRQFNAKLAESVEEGVTDYLVNLGGAEVYTRADLQKVLEEQKFQMSGLVDESTLVNIGKLAGVKYIVTGAVNNVNLKWVTLEEVKSAAKRHLGLVGSLIAIGAEQQEGWNLETDVALRIIDVETGKVVFSKIVHGKHIIGKTPYPNYDALIGGIKEAAKKALLDASPELSKWFSVKGYIYQIRRSPDGKQKAALVNIGSKAGLKPGSELVAYAFQAIQDPFTGQVTCDVVKLPVTLRVTNQIQEDKAWVIIEGTPEYVNRLRPGQLVERAALKGQSAMQKMGH
ncbi:MAG: curli production assembly protein CsgG [Nitrospirae bacterium]|nr:MAG: curli production assembly protein CsgG [Nitrospirota bacterium]